MASLIRPIRFINSLLVTNLYKTNLNLTPKVVQKRTLYASNVVQGREFLLDTTDLEKVKAQANENPFPVRYMEFTACQEMYEMFAAYGMNKPPAGVKFNAAYIDTNPNAKKSTPTVVCLHGSPGGHWDFNHLTVYLAEKGYRVIALNFPGYGWTKMDVDREFENSTEEKAFFVKDFLYSLGIEKVKMGVVHSSGVYPGLVLSSENMNVFESLTLINAGGLGYHKVLRPYPVLRFHARYYRNPIMRPFLLFFLKFALLVTGFGNTNAFQMSVALESLMNIPYEEYKAYPTSMADRQFPSIFLHSLNDRAVELKLSEEFCSLLAGGNDHLKYMYDEDGQLISSNTENINKKFMEHHIFASGGHFVMKRYPDAVNEIIHKFLQNVIRTKP